jgi:hypothetical protein
MQTEGDIIMDADSVAEEMGGDIAADTDVVTEFTGKASYHSNLSGPLQLVTNFDWNADTGATSHMTPHRNFLCNYTIFHTTIRLADNTVVYSEGVAEHANCTMADDITAMLNESNLPASFWNEALAAMIHVWNHLPTFFLPSSTPHEEWYKKKPDVSHLHVFGCTAYVFIQKDQQKKLSSHAQKCIFVGYPPEYKGWKFYNPITKKFIISECAEFDEHYFPGLTKSSNTAPIQLLPSLDSGSTESEEIMPFPDAEPVLPSTAVDHPVTPYSSPPHTPVGTMPPFMPSTPGPRMRPADWNNHLPCIPALQLNDLNHDDDSDDLEPSIDSESSIDLGGYGQVDLAESAHSSVHNTDPPTYAAAMKCSDAKQWQEAAEAEMEQSL